MYYGPDILLAAGLSIPGYDDNESALLLNIPLSFVNAVGTTIACAYIDSLGRRYIILRTLPFAMIGWFVTAAGMYFSGFHDSVVGSYVAFGGIVIFLFTYSIGFSSTPWTINAEIYPLHVIGTANSLSTTTNWTTNFVVATVFLIFLETPLGSVLAFLVLGTFTGLAWLFVYCLLPETANKTIEDILTAILGEKARIKIDS